MKLNLRRSRNEAEEEEGGSRAEAKRAGGESKDRRADDEPVRKLQVPADTRNNGTPDRSTEMSVGRDI